MSNEKRPLKYPFYPALLARYTWLEANLFCFLLARQVWNKKRKGKLSVTISGATLARIFNLRDPTTISRAVKALRKAGAITIFRAKNRASRYVVASLDTALGRMQESAQEPNLESAQTPGDTGAKADLGIGAKAEYLDTSYLSVRASTDAHAHTQNKSPLPPKGGQKDTRCAPAASPDAQTAVAEEWEAETLRSLREQAQQEIEAFELLENQNG